MKIYTTSVQYPNFTFESQMEYSTVVENVVETLFVQWFENVNSVLK